MSVDLMIGLLEERRLFGFEDAVREAIEGFYGSAERDPSGRPVEVEAGLTVASAAELTLAAFLASPPADVRDHLPRRVDELAGRLSLAKTNCTMFGGCAPSEKARLWDMTVFSGDVSKIVERELAPLEVEADDVFGLVSALEDAYDRAGNEHARQLARSRTVQLQGLLWQAKASLLTGNDPADALDAYMARFGLGMGMGV